MLAACPVAVVGEPLGPKFQLNWQLLKKVAEENQIPLDVPIAELNKKNLEMIFISILKKLRQIRLDIQFIFSRGD